MPQEADPQYLEIGLLALQWLLGTSLAGGIALLLTLLYLKPRLTILEVRNRHPEHSFESRLIVKNIGKLPAYQVYANVYDFNGTMAGNQFQGFSLVRNGPPVSRLDGEETMELPVIPQIGMTPGLPIDSCEYKLELEHDYKLFLKNGTTKRLWKIELRKFEDSFTWQFSPL